MGRAKLEISKELAFNPIKQDVKVLIVYEFIYLFYLRRQVVLTCAFVLTTRTANSALLTMVMATCGTTVLSRRYLTLDLGSKDILG